MHPINVALFRRHGFGELIVTQIPNAPKHACDREFARRCYRASIRHRPLLLKTYFRLGWAMLPTGVSQRLSPMLSPGLRRSLSGPPFLEERTQ